MTKLPELKTSKVSKALNRLGFQEVRHKGKVLTAGVVVTHDSITPYEIPGDAGAKDNFPLMKPYKPGGVVTFPDLNLEAAIREAINKPEGDIYQSDLEELTKLYASGRGISNPSGMEYCIKLTELYLGENQISDISPLKNLTSLTDLDLGRNQISDISALSKLTDLIALFLDGNKIADITPLSGLTKLGEVEEEWWLNERGGVKICLGLSNNKINDIKPLLENEGLSEEDGIDLWDNPLSDESCNTYIPQLEERGVAVLYTKKLPGDVNLNGKVNIADLALVAAAFNIKEGDKCWNANADLNGDKIIDI